MIQGINPLHIILTRSCQRNTKGLYLNSGVINNNIRQGQTKQINSFYLIASKDTAEYFKSSLQS